MTATVALETLTLFNEKTDRLLSSSFFKKIRGGGAIVEFRRDSGWDGVFVGPDEESIEALVLTLRLFVQNNDRLSLQNMHSLYNSLSISSSIATDFAACYSELNAFLDTDSNLSIKEGCQLTHREILEIFLYGTYAHVNQKHRRVFEGIRETAFFPMFQSCLAKAIIGFAHSIWDLRQINDLALKELRAANSGPA